MIRVEYALGQTPRLGTPDFGAYDYAETGENRGYVPPAGTLTTAQAIALAAQDLARDRPQDLEDAREVRFLTLVLP